MALEKPKAMREAPKQEQQSALQNNIKKPANANKGKSYEDRVDLAKEKIKQSFLRELLYTKDKNNEFVENAGVTDISFNGKDMYVQDNEFGRYKVDSERDPRIRQGLSPLNVTPKKVEDLGNTVQNVMGSSWNSSNPIMDCELGELRTNFMHKAVSPYGVTFALRVSRPRLAIQDISKMCDSDTAQLLEVFMRCDFNLLISGQTGSGKSSPKITPIPTPDGWKTMGDLRIGDYVFDRVGKPTKVTGVFPQGKLEVFEVTFNDGRKVLCNDEHLWSTISKHGKLTTYTTRYLMENNLHGIHNNLNHCFWYIPTNGTVEYPENNELETDPYVLGAFLGDGHFTAKSLTLSSENDWIPNKVANIIGAVGVKNQKGSYSYDFLLPENHQDLGLFGHTLFQTKDIIPDDLIGHYGIDKFIPERYKISSIRQRYELLRGLLDTDGFISKTGKISYSTGSIRLAKDVQELVRSLGYKATITEDVREGRNTNYAVLILCHNDEKELLFTLPRKLERAKAMKGKYIRARYDRMGIIDIRSLGYEEEQVCIMVDNDEHLYLTNDFIVTHNTEFQKKLISFIPKQKKISLMEDTLDSHIKEIYPEKDINSWATSGERGEDNYIGFPELIRAGLRNNPDWLMISEVRGAEALDLLSAALTGHSIMTTLHATGADNIPSRLSNMVSMNENSPDYEALQLDIVSVLNLGMHLEMQIDPVTGKISRVVREIFEYMEYQQGLGIIGNPLYQRTQEYDEDTGEYSTNIIKNRLSDGLLTKIKNKKELHLVPKCYAQGNKY